MTQYLYEVQIGNFIGLPEDSIWAYNVEQMFNIFVEADNLSQANREIERRFGNYTRCRYKYTGKEIDQHNH